MKKLITFVPVLVFSAASLADISSPALQQALHDSVSSEDGFASDHVFTCQDRSIVRCDESNNVIYLTQYISYEEQLNADLGVFSDLEGYRLIAETNLTRLPVGLDNLPALVDVDIISNGFTLPAIDGNAFPETLYSLSVNAPYTPVALTNWGAHSLARLSLNSPEIDFNFIQLPGLARLALADSGSVINEDFESFVSVSSFSWRRMYKEDLSAYYATRFKFPLLSDEMVEINLNRQYGEPKLAEIPAYVLDIPNLQSLEITGHAITELPSQLFLMPALKRLDVSFNQLETLPAINEGSSIESLLLRANKLTQIPEALFKLSELRYLDLLGNKIDSLPAEIFAMDNLQELNARNNVIESITVAATATALQVLMLDGNKLLQVPAELFQMEGLLTLDIGRNELTALPEITSGSATLQTLRVNYNKIDSLPASFLNYLPLQELQVSNNELSSLPAGIVNSSLESINLSANKFLQVPDELSLFGGMKKAYFADNKIETLGEQWKQSPLLEELSVRGNRLAELTADMLSNLPSALKLLSLKDNKMVGELPAFFRTNPELEVDISGNALWSTDSNVLQQYAGSNVLEGQLLPVRGIRVIEKNVKGDLVSYIQWGFPLMQDIADRTRGIHALNFPRKVSSDESFSDVNPGPYISTGYQLVIEYTQGKKAGETITKRFNCLFNFAPSLCGFDGFSASYDTETYATSVFSYAIKGSLAGAKITVYSTLHSLLSSPTYWGSTEKHEQFVDEIEYDETVLPLLEVKNGSINRYHLLAFLVIWLARMCRSNNAFKNTRGYLV